MRHGPEPHRDGMRNRGWSESVLSSSFSSACRCSGDRRGRASWFPCTEARVRCDARWCPWPAPPCCRAPTEGACLGNGAITDAAGRYTILVGGGPVVPNDLATASAAGQPDHDEAGVRRHARQGPRQERLRALDDALARFDTVRSNAASRVRWNAASPKATASSAPASGTGAGRLPREPDTAVHLQRGGHHPLDGVGAPRTSRWKRRPTRRRGRRPGTTRPSRRRSACPRRRRACRRSGASPPGSCRSAGRTARGPSRSRRSRRASGRTRRAARRSTATAPRSRMPLDCVALAEPSPAKSRSRRRASRASRVWSIAGSARRRRRSRLSRSA